jgi:hypothetical protein
MPLIRAKGRATPEIDGIYFPMERAGISTRVVCRVSYEALRAISGAQSGYRPAMIAVFSEYRDEIESIASRKYDAGEKNPYVTTFDLIAEP